MTKRSHDEAFNLDEAMSGLALNGRPDKKQRVDFAELREEDARPVAKRSRLEDEGSSQADSSSSGKKARVQQDEPSRAGAASAASSSGQGDRPPAQPAFRFAAGQETAPEHGAGQRAAPAPASEQAANPRAPQAPASRSRDTDDQVLIPMERWAVTGETRYVTLKMFREENSRLTDDDIKKELDKRAVLIESHTGALLTKAGTRFVMKDEAKFNERMDELGLSRNPFNEKHGARLTDKDRYFETPGGIREKAVNFKHAEQAGVHSPDILVRHGDFFQAFYPSKRPEISSFEDLKSQYDAVYLKTTGNNYMPPELLNRRQGAGAAEKAFDCFTKDRVPLNGRGPSNDSHPLGQRKEHPGNLPKVLYRTSDNNYVPKDEYLAHPGARTTADGKIDPKQVDVLLQSSQKNSLLDPAIAKRLSKGDQFQKALEHDGLAEKDVLKPGFKQSRPQILVSAEGKFLNEEGARNLAASMGKPRQAPLAEIFNKDDVYVQNVSNGRNTGNYRNVTTILAKNEERSPVDKLAALNIVANEGHARAQQPAAGLPNPGGLPHAAGPAPTQMPASTSRRYDERTRDGSRSAA